MTSNETPISVRIGSEDTGFPPDTPLSDVQRFADARGESILWCRFAISAGNPPGVSAQARPSPRSIPKRTHAPPSEYGNVRVVRLQATRDGVSQPVTLYGLGMATKAEEAYHGRGFGTVGCYRQPDEVPYHSLPFGTKDGRTSAEKQKNIFRVLLTTPEGIPWKHKQRVGIRSKDTALVFFLLFSPKDTMERVLECFLHRDKVGNWDGLVKAVRERIDSLERIVVLCKNASGGGQSHEWDDDAGKFTVFNEDSPTLPLAKPAKSASISKKKRSPEQMAVLEKHSEIQREKKKKETHIAPAAERSLGSVVAGYTDDIPDLD